MKTIRKTLMPACALAILTVAPGVSAQSVLQAPGGNLQPQSNNSAQATGNSQNQVDTLQNNNSQPVLTTQSGVRRSLGVVSSPNQTQPEAVVAPDPSLKTDYIRRDNANNIWFFVAGAVILGLIAWWIHALRREAKLTKSEQIQPTQIVRPEPQPKPKKIKKAPKKKRKKAHQR